MLGPLPDHRMLRLMWLTLADPKQVADETIAEHAAQRPLTQEEIDRDFVQWLRFTHEIRDGFFHAFGWVMLAGLTGFAIGRIAAANFGRQDVGAALIGLLGGLLLFGATTAIQGWSIQTSKGVSLPERLNQSIYRMLTVIGTMLVVISGSWGLLPV